MQKILHSTPSTDEPEVWESLLASLSDDELVRYGEIALDQRDLEYGYWWAQVLLGLAAAVAFVWGLWQFTISAWGTRGFLALGASVVLGYWPYRKFKMRRLWQGHFEAVAREQARRGTRVD